MSWAQWYVLGAAITMIVLWRRTLAKHAQTQRQRRDRHAADDVAYVATPRQMRRETYSGGFFLALAFIGLLWPGFALAWLCGGIYKEYFGPIGPHDGDNRGDRVR